MYTALEGVALLVTDGLPISGVPEQMLAVGSQSAEACPLDSIFVFAALPLSAGFSRPHRYSGETRRRRRERRGFQNGGHQNRPYQDYDLCFKRPVLRHRRSCNDRPAHLANAPRATDGARRSRRQPSAGKPRRRRGKHRRDRDWRTYDRRTQQWTRSHEYDAVLGRRLSWGIMIVEAVVPWTSWRKRKFND